VYALANQWFIPKLKDYVYHEKLDSTYEEIVKRNNSEGKESEEL
jgi:hypothetical protein